MSRRQTDVPADIVELLRRGYGLATTAAAQRAGVPVGRLRRLTDAGLLTQLARGCYADTSRIKALDEWGQHKERARAFAISCGSDTYLIGSVVRRQLAAPDRRHAAVIAHCRPS